MIRRDRTRWPEAGTPLTGRGEPVGNEPHRKIDAGRAYSPSDNAGMDKREDQIHRGVGSVCVAAASREWWLAYCSSVLLCRGDDWFRLVAAKSGKPIEEFRRLVNAIRVHEPAEYVRGETSGRRETAAGGATPRCSLSDDLRA